ncbi:MAG: guanylate kinase [bacterium]|jgi:guanylate kinase
MAERGRLIIFSAPSGAGKTTLVKHVMQCFDNLDFSVSAASRPKRKGEVDGKDYYFMTTDEFREKIEQNAFVEWEEVYPGHYYGTLFSEVERVRNQNKHIVFDVDVKGGMNIKKIYGDDALAIFVKPPSVESLEDRLRGRGAESEEKIQMRLAKASAEMDYEKMFDVTIINDRLSEAKNKAYDLVKKFISSHL